MPETTKQPEWKGKTSAAYKDAMKTVLSLETASLVFPKVLVRTFAVGSVPKDHLTRRAYISWLLLFLSLLAGCSSWHPLKSVKYLKVIAGGKSDYDDGVYEHARDWACGLSIGFFVAGIYSGASYFLEDARIGD